MFAFEPALTWLMTGFGWFSDNRAPSHKQAHMCSTQRPCTLSSLQTLTPVYGGNNCISAFAKPPVLAEQQRLEGADASVQRGNVLRGREFPQTPNSELCWFTRTPAWFSPLLRERSLFCQVTAARSSHVCQWTSLKWFAQAPLLMKQRKKRQVGNDFAQEISRSRVPLRTCAHLVGYPGFLTCCSF